MQEVDIKPSLPIKSNGIFCKAMPIAQCTVVLEFARRWMLVMQDGRIDVRTITVLFRGASMGPQRQPGCASGVGVVP